MAQVSTNTGDRGTPRRFPERSLELTDFTLIPFDCSKANRERLEREPEKQNHAFVVGMWQRVKECPSVPPLCKGRPGGVEPNA